MKKELQKYANRAYSTQGTIQASYDMMIKVIEEGIQGVVVECGVAAGAQLGAMIEAMKDKNDLRAIYAFDSFEGIPKASSEDSSQPGRSIFEPDDSIEAQRTSSGVTVCSVNQVKQHMKEWGHDDHPIEYVKGWFIDTLPNTAMEPIALLRLDGDLYWSTSVCLHHLWDHLVEGGILIIDDWALDGCRRAVEQFFSMLKTPPKLLFIADENGSTPAYFQKL